MIAKLAWGVLLAGLTGLNAGMIHGVVLDHATGRPLSRTLVRVEPLGAAGAAAGRPVVVRSERAGAFTFASLAPGLYRLTAGREGYFEAAPGQRRPGGAAPPVQVTADGDLFFELRMQRKSAISGRVVDENGVGIAGFPVMAYRGGPTLRAAAGARSDDRGEYRIGGLDPGVYLVRTEAHTLADGSRWVPTFASAGRELQQAQPARVTASEEAAGVEVSPEQGQLFRIGGAITCSQPGAVTVVLTHETGRRVAAANCPGQYEFSEVPPGPVELLALQGEIRVAGFLEDLGSRDSLAFPLNLLRMPRLDLEVALPDGELTRTVPVQLFGRRVDLAWMGDEVAFDPRGALVVPGYWLLRASAPAGYAVVAIEPGRGDRTERLREKLAALGYGRPDDGVLVRVPESGGIAVRVRVTGQVGRLTGRVAGGTAGVPVLLRPLSAAVRRMLPRERLRQMADATGAFEFADLPAGDYQAIASWDLEEFDEAEAQRSGAPVVAIGAGATVRVELSVWPPL